MTLNVMSDDGARDLSFYLSTVSMPDSDRAIDMIYGVTDDGLVAEIHIPKNDTPVLTLWDKEPHCE